MSLFNKVFAITFAFNCFIGLSLLNPPSIFAQEIFFEDNFDSGNLQKWQPTEDNGSLWSIVDGKARVKVDRGSRKTELVPKDEFWQPNSPDMKISLDLTFLKGLDRNFTFRWTAKDSWYQLHFKDTFFNLARVLGGKIFGLDEFIEYEFKNDQEYHLDLYLKNDQIWVYINDEFIVNQTDPSFDGTIGKIGLKVHTGSIFPSLVEFDNVVVSEWVSPPGFETVELDVERVMQTDPEWASEIYNSATSWSLSEAPTIHRWGCALASMVMVLDYHQIKTFADQSPINPSTLNQWLLNQPDGYVGEGLVNWLAVTRLTKQLSDQFQTPTLEFTFAGENLDDLLQQDLVIQQPVIANVPDHFLVVDGYQQSPTQIRYSIADPFYDKNWLDEHSELISIRQFKPSFTDLSYILLVAPSTVEFSHADDWTIVEEQIEAAHIENNQVTQNKKFKLVAIPKPSRAQYRLDYSVPEATAVKSYVYDLHGEVSISELTLNNSGQLLFDQALNYRVQEILTPTKIVDILTTLETDHHIYRQSVARHLERIANYYAASESSEHRRLYLQLWQDLLIEYEPDLSSHAQATLSNLLEPDPDN